MNLDMFLVAVIFCAVGLWGGALLVVNAETPRAAYEAKTQCEQTLPRNQRCVITAVPEDLG